MMLSGRVAVVTGATCEIGRAIALRLAGEGAAVAITGQTEAKVEAVAADLKQSGATFRAEALDLSRPDAVEGLFNRTAEELAPVDILVNVAAWRKGGSFMDTDHADWRRTFEVCVDSYFLCSKAAAAQMIEKNWGRIILFGSVSGVVYMSPFPAYTAAKGAVHAMTAALSGELAPYGITVNEVAPGPVETAYVRENLPPDAIQSRIDRIPMGRMATPEDCAAAVCHLVSPDMGYVTGQSLYVEGGFLRAGAVPPARLRKDPS